jgi:hypothetical protein
MTLVSRSPPDSRIIYAQCGKGVFLFDKFRFSLTPSLFYRHFQFSASLRFRFLAEFKFTKPLVILRTIQQFFPLRHFVCLYMFFVFIMIFCLYFPGSMCLFFRVKVGIQCRSIPSHTVFEDDFFFIPIFRCTGTYNIHKSTRLSHSLKLNFIIKIN